MPAPGPRLKHRSKPGSVERFHRILLDEWAYLRPYTSNDERTERTESLSNRVATARFRFNRSMPHSTLCRAL
jgi:hypothetical protein